ncbi:ribokinase [Robbsia sp. Bb-Pol-6]|uniref:Ribokinase n=1 Tax=Robbsia betulipollinis TaxID=2981849 RepID=A0ABT3ZT05_9BURK|nr:ribokinase [Robbsia betulipollinis]
MEARTGRVAVIGSLNMDLVVRAPRLPQPGETLAGTAFDQVPGGKGANQAVAAARLGAQVGMLGRLGQDANGTQLLQAMQDEGIDCSRIGRDATHPTGVALIVVDDASQNTIVIIAGSNGALDTAAVEAHADLIAQADVVVCQLEVPEATVLAALRRAHALGRTVILNPAPVTGPLPQGWLENVDFLVPNEVEAAALSGVAVDSPDSARRAARVLQQQGARHVLITLGGQGVFLLPPADAAGNKGIDDDTRGTHYPARRVAAVDTTAAGDTFIGGFAAALAAGRPLDEAVRFGQAAAALSVTRAGAQPSIPYFSEIQPDAPQTSAP